MDDRFLNYYNRELQHVRETAAEFARAHPQVAGRLSLDEFECADPYVERLLEGFAFLAARVQMKLDAEYPRFTRHLIETVYPHLLAPIPSMAIVQMRPSSDAGALAAGPRVAARTMMRGEAAADEQTRCLFRTAHDVRLWPLEIQEAAYHGRDLAALGLPASERARAAVRIRFRATGPVNLAELPIENLDLYLRGGDQAMRLYEQLTAHAIGAIVHSPARPPAWTAATDRAPIEPIGFLDEQALLPVASRSFSGYRLLQEYFALPERYHFVRLCGLAPGVARVVESNFDVTILLDELDQELEGAVSGSSFALYCTPVVNLFEKRLDRIHVRDRAAEHHVVVDRTAPLDFEVHQLLEVRGYGGDGTSSETEFRSFYSGSARTGDAANAYYSADRRPTLEAESSRAGRTRRRTRYQGTELFLSLVDSNAAPYGEDVRQIGMRASCTNRDLCTRLPIGQVPTDFTLDVVAPVTEIRCVVRPTPPIPALTDDAVGWNLISHLQPNYLSLSDTRGGDAGSALRSVLGIYMRGALPESAKRVNAVRAVASESIVRRVSREGPAAFGRGLQILVTMDEAEFGGSGIVVFGAVLERFFARYVGINLFTETVLHSEQRGEVRHWPARIGNRELI